MNLFQKILPVLWGIILCVSVPVFGATFGSEDRPLFSFLKSERRGPVREIKSGISWIPESGGDGMGVTEVDFSVGIGLPAPKYKVFTNSFFLVSPKFAYTNIQWKAPTRFPGSLYSAGVSLAWMKRVNERWSLMFNVTPGYSGDGKASKDTVRCPVLFAATWTPNSKWKVILGAIYSDRGDYPFIPFAGATYTPNEDWRYEIILPRPRIVRRLNAWSNGDVERWLYLGGSFGGGNWGIESEGGRDDQAMYREFSLLLGCESADKTTSLKWNAEIGWIFSRKMEFDRHTQRDVDLDDALALRLRCSF